MSEVVIIALVILRHKCHFHEITSSSRLLVDLFLFQNTLLTKIRKYMQILRS